ncbi:MAG: CvpA family protein [Bacillota bacterium]|jgi:membrane protein required for colicin V production
MGLLDIILLIVIGLSALEGLKRGLIKLLVQLGGVIAAFIVASRYGVAFGQTLSGVLKIEDYAASLESPFLNVDAVANILYNSLGYIILFFAVLLAAWLISIILGAVGKAPVLGAMDRVGGLVVGLLRGCLIVLVAVWILNLLPIPWAETAVQSSQIAQTFLSIAPGLYQRLRAMIGA